MENKKNKIIEDWETLEEQYRAACMMSCKPDSSFRKVKTGEILDEEQSVRWNREEVERLKKEYGEEVKRLNRQKNSAVMEVTKKIIHKLGEELDVSDEKASILWDFLYDKYHAYGEMFNFVDEYVMLLTDVMR